MEMDAATFENLVVDELDLLPDAMVEGLENVVFVVEDRPED
ncbi:MAG: metallopeptidase family protein, partial [Microbacterium sp.]